MLPTTYAFLHFGQVLQEMLKILPKQPIVTGVMIDFEAAMWKALAAVLPDVQIKGCAFHLSQAVWRKVQELGLQKAYTDDEDVHKIIRLGMYSIQIMKFEPVKVICLLKRELTNLFFFLFRKLLALPFLPPQHIPPAFDRMDSRNTNSMLVPLSDTLETRGYAVPFGHPIDGLFIRRPYAQIMIVKDGIDD